jgi:hypothetical protein
MGGFGVLLFCSSGSRPPLRPSTSAYNLAHPTIAQVGKTALMFRYVEDRFETKVTTNVGVAFLAKTVEIDGSQVKVQVWDTAGQVFILSLVITFLCVDTLCR